MTARIATFVGYVVVPVVGILFFGWDWRSLILLYWLENITVGLRNAISMARTERTADPGASGRFTVNGRPAESASKPFLVLFFVFHYGLFTLVHGVFVMIIVFAGGFGLFGEAESTGIDAVGGEWLGLGGILLVWGIASVVQIIADLFVPRASLPPAASLFLAPYGRILALHVTIILGAWLIASLGWPPSAAILLVALHFALDLWSPFGRRGGRVALTMGSSGD